MKIVKIIGGLGNQMFQYAFYLSLKKKYPEEVIKIDTTMFDTYGLHNGFELKSIFDVDAEYASRQDIRRLSFFVGFYKIQRVLRKMLPTRKTECIEKNDFDFMPVVWSNNDRYYEGYWQNQKYFVDAQAEVRAAFTFKKELSKRNLELIEKIQSAETSVSLHIRRGDYLNHKLFGGICDIDYYKKAIEYVLENCDTPQFYLFSNDMEWCRINILPLVKGKPLTFVDWNSGLESYIDMQLMSCCRINIIANSSFSWWAAWLNDSFGKMVIAPKLWAHSPWGAEIQLKSWHLI